MQRTLGIIGIVALAALAAADATAQTRRAKAARTAPAAEAAPYTRDVITVASNGRHGTPASATCVVWANAEGLGVGPEQLNGFHGISFNINPKPLPTETDVKPDSMAGALKTLRAQTPPPPAWMLLALERNAARIDAACSEEHVEPLVITRLTAKDKTAG